MPQYTVLIYQSELPVDGGVEVRPIAGSFGILGPS
jgi:hypothetical protein